MSAPKRLRILYAVRDRLQVINQAAGYYTDVGRDVRLDRRDPDLEHAPLCHLYFEAGEVQRTQNERQSIDQPVTIVAVAPLKSHEPEELGEMLLADIQRAVELNDRSLGGLLSLATEGLQPVAFEISMPESGSNVVAAAISYAAPYIRPSGDPEIL